jgi:polysaccharide export outer membrane protein
MSVMRTVSAVLMLLWCLAPLAGAQEDETSDNGAYRVGIGDVIDVEAFQEEEISGEFSVEASGAITFPLLGSVPVVGMTPAEIAVLLEELLEKDYYVDVQLKVEVEVFASQPVTLLGEVNSPGTYYLEGRTTLTEMLAKAGGLKSSAGPVLELRRTERREGEGPPEPMIFETAKLSTGEAGRDVILRAGDVLYVSPKKIYFITGEVARPGQYEISLGMTLLQAISQAGGVGKFASQVIEIHRDVDGEKKILSFDLSHIRKGRMADPPVMSGDVIFVKRRFF